MWSYQRDMTKPCHSRKADANKRMAADLLYCTTHSRMYAECCEVRDEARADREAQEARYKRDAEDEETYRKQEALTQLVRDLASWVRPDAPAMYRETADAQLARALAKPEEVHAA